MVYLKLKFVFNSFFWGGGGLKKKIYLRNPSTFKQFPFVDKSVHVQNVVIPSCGLGVPGSRSGSL
jgi:hypothetical protein